MAIAADLTKTITLHELLSWRLHWVLCDVWQIDEQIKRARITDETVIELIEMLEQARIKHDRVIWEVETMIDSDGYYSVPEALKTHPKFISLIKAMAETTERITELSDRLAQQKHEQIQAKLDRAKIR